MLGLIKSRMGISTAGVGGLVERMIRFVGRSSRGREDGGGGELFIR